MMALFDDFLITSDYDLTITGPDGAIPQRNIDAIRYFMENGGAFTVNTGRSGVSARSVMEKVPVNAPFLLMNGSSMMQNGETLELHTIDLEPWPLLTQLEKAVPGVVTEVQDNRFHYIYSSCLKRIAQHERLGWTYKMVNVGDDVGPFAKFNVYPTEAAVQAGKQDPAQRQENIRLLDRAQEYLNAHFGDKLEVYRSGPEFLNVHAKGCSKIAAARRLQKQLGRKHLVCIGDEHNDISMLDGADFAFCPADGMVADRYETVCSSGEGAVADVIYKKIPGIMGITP